MCSECLMFHWLRWLPCFDHLICMSENKIVILFPLRGHSFYWTHTWFKCFIFSITQALNPHQNCEYLTGLLAFAYNHLSDNCHHSLNLSLTALIVPTLPASLSLLEKFCYDFKFIRQQLWMCTKVHTWKTLFEHFIRKASHKTPNVESEPTAKQSTFISVGGKIKNM